MAKKRLNIAEQYIEDVVNKRVDVCLYTRLAVERHVEDLKSGIDRGLYFDIKSGEKAINFFSFLRYTSGRQFAGKKFELSPVQAFIQYIIFGWKKSDGTRRFNYAYMEFPRKFGKTTMAAGGALYLLDADNEASAEVFAVATKEDQARKTFNEASNLVKASPFLNKSLSVQKKSIYNELTYSFFKPLGSDSNTQDSHNPHGVIIDEYHAHPDDSMVNVMKSGMGARVQPLMYIITTAGFNKNGPCYQERETCIKILKGILKQDNKFAIIFTLDEEDNWEDEDKWIKANPHIGLTVSMDYMRNEYVDAKNNPSRINNFKTKNLNIWTNEEISWITDEVWQSCNSGLKLEDLWGRPCHGGIDLASHVDINAFAILFTDKQPYDLWVFMWCPADKIQERKDKVDYDLWEQQGWIKGTGGNVVDIDTITSDIINILDKVDCKGISFDPARAFHGVVQNLMKEVQNGEEFFTPFRQGFISMDTPTKELEKLALSKNINHGGNPVMRWMNSNVVIVSDAAGNIKIDKKRSQEKVDGMVATVMAIGEFMTPTEGVDFNEFMQDRIKQNKSIF